MVSQKSSTMIIPSKDIQSKNTTMIIPSKDIENKNIQLPLSHGIKRRYGRSTIKHHSQSINERSCNFKLSIKLGIRKI